VTSEVQDVEASAPSGAAPPEVPAVSEADSPQAHASAPDAAPLEDATFSTPSEPAPVDSARVDLTQVDLGPVEVGDAAPAQPAEQVQPAVRPPDDPVVDEDEAPEQPKEVPRPGPTAAVGRPPGVVAAHEPSLPPLKLLLDSAQAAPKWAAIPRPPAPAPGTLAAPTTTQGPGLRSEPPGRSPSVDVPLDFIPIPVDPPRPLAGGTEPPRAPAYVERTRPVEAPPTVPVAKPVLEPLVCLVDSAADYVKARALGRVLSDNRELPSVLIVHTGSVANLEVGEEIAGVMPQKASDVHLDINEHGGAASAALAITRFDAVLRVYRPKAIIAMGASDTLLTCTLFAHKSGIPILRNDAGRRRAWSRPGEEMNALLLERLADTSYISDLATYYTLYRSGIATDRVLLVGNLADNVLHFAAQHTVHPAEILRRVGTAVEPLANPRGYALCTAQLDAPRAGHDDATGLVSMLTVVGRELPVIWAANETTLHELKAQGKLAGLKAAHINVAPSLRYLDCIDLLRGARCLLAGSTGHCLDDAITLGVPGIVLGQGVVVPVKSTEALQLSSSLEADQLPAVLAELLANPIEMREKVPFWDGAAAARIAVHLGEWLPTHGASKKRGKPAPGAAQRPKHPDAAIELLGTATH
jgi:UDP-N-acetylglucosamine 2-epimerase